MKPAEPDYDAPCPACGKPVGDHTLRGYAQELSAAGFDYSMPLAEVPGGPLRVKGVDADIAGEVFVEAAVWTTPIGPMPVLLQRFIGSGETPMSKVPLRSILLALDGAGLRAYVELVASAVDQAIVAAVEAQR